MPTPPSKRHSERGAVLVYVALIMGVVFGLTAFVLDQGVFWLARRQAQNAADAGALAGAIARVFDEPAAAGPLTTASATIAAATNLVFGATPAVEVDTPLCPEWAGGGPDCVQVRVFRDTAHGNPLPIFFSDVFPGNQPQDVQAHAIAKASVANAVKCIKPWIVPDTDPPYDRSNIGDTIMLTGDTDMPSFYMKVRLDRGEPPSYCPGIPCYLDNITSCTTRTYKIGDEVIEQPGVGPPIDDEVNQIIAQDPSASWDGTKIVNSCAPTCGCGVNCLNGQGGFISPRIVPVAIGDPSSLVPGSAVPFEIVNIFSFFLLPVTDGRTLNGILVSTTGVLVDGGDSVTAENSFLAVPLLIQ